MTPVYEILGRHSYNKAHKSLEMPGQNNHLSQHITRATKERANRSNKLIHAKALHRVCTFTHPQLQSSKAEKSNW